MRRSLVKDGTDLSVSALLESGTAYLKTWAIDAPRLTAEHLLAAILVCPRLTLFLVGEKRVSQEQHAHFWNDLTRRAAHEPLQYITGQVEFWEMLFIVEKGVFIPRPETELIVEAALALNPSPRRILDLCTGSGALAIALAKVFPEAYVVASDISDRALEIARINAEKHTVASRLTFLKGDLFEPLKRDRFSPTCFDLRFDLGFDLIVCNPPYISESDREGLPPEVRDYEPSTALFAEDQGRAFYPRILAEAPFFLCENGVMFLELGYDQSEWLRGFIERDINASARTRATAKRLDAHFIQDWAGIERVARISEHPIKTKEG